MHPARLKQIRDVDPLPQRGAEVVVRAAHETRIIVLRPAGTAFEASGVVVIGAAPVRETPDALSEKFSHGP